VAAKRCDKTGQAAGSSALYRALAHPRLAIIGDPGAGKTTFLRWVAHTLSGDRLRKAPGAARAVLGLDQTLVPLLVPIADWLDCQGRLSRRNQGPPLNTAATWLPEYLAERAAAGNQGLDRSAFLDLLAGGQALILLDGLDEAPDPRRRAEAVGLIEALAHAYPDCPLVVTTRPAAYRDKAVLTGFTQTTIEALDAEAIDGFLRRWSQALFPEQSAKAEAHHHALQGALQGRREIRRMARNTVMLTALAVVHWNEKRLPEQRAELYEARRAQGRRPGQRHPGPTPAEYRLCDGAPRSATPTPLQTTGAGPLRRPARRPGPRPGPVWLSAVRPALCRGPGRGNGDIRP